jgi:hypothetical protein
MGSKISKALGREADASVTPATLTRDNHDINNTNERSRQGPAPQLSNFNTTGDSAPLLNALVRDDINVKSSTTSTMNSPRRYSAGHSTDRQDLLNSFEQYIAERQMRAIDYLASMDELPFQPLPAPAPIEPVPQCMICCLDLPKDGEKKSIKPCRSCYSIWCTSCVRKAFIDASKDVSRMPPRCCAPINLHHAKPYLDAEEVALFRSKYEEWCTTNPTYCPIPVCSAFIPDRLVPQHARTKSKQRIDSGIGTPKSTSFPCPTCEADICCDCRQQAHPGIMCNIHEFGLDAETAELLKAWGYKKCPKCGHGVKRMYGCHHMECRCGANFCWLCLAPVHECDGQCGDNDSAHENHSDDESDEEFPDGERSDEETEATTQEDSTADRDITAPRPTLHPRNLDGGGHRHWEDAGLDFGDEPQGGGEEAMWDCDHTFVKYTIPLATALTSHSTEMECTKCWNAIHPTIDAPKAPRNEKEKLVPASASRTMISRVGGNINRGRERYAPPRGLFRANATIGTAPHLTTTMSQSLPTRQLSYMEDVQFSERITDTYGNVITTTPMQPSRRASLASPDPALKQKSHAHTSKSNVFANSPSTFSLAHECEYCYMLVCESCMIDTLEVRKAEMKKSAEEEEKMYEVPERARTHQMELDDVWREVRLWEESFRVAESEVVKEEEKVPSEVSHRERVEGGGQAGTTTLQEAVQEVHEDEEMACSTFD